MSEFDTGAHTIATSIAIDGLNGNGFVELPNQVGPVVRPSPGAVRTFAGPTGAFHVMNDSTGASITLPPTDRTYSLPDDDGEVLTATSTAVVSGKTILAANNIVDASSIAGFNIAGVPANGEYLVFDGGDWKPQAITASAPIAYSAGNIAATIGSTANTLAAGDDARFATKSAIRVKKGIAGAGEFNSIAAALATITDSSVSNPYFITVGPGVYIEPPLVLQPYVSIVGATKFSTIIMPNAPGGTAVTMSSKCSFESMTLSGHGSGVGILCDSCMNAIIENVIVANFAVCAHFIATTAINDVLLHEFLFVPPLLIGVHVDGRDVTGAFLNKASVSMGRVRGDANTTHGILFEGPHTNIAANSIRSIDATNGVGVYLTDGCDVDLGNSKIVNCAEGMLIANVGVGPLIAYRDILFDANVHDITIAHPGTLGIFDGIADRTKVTINAAAPVAVSYRDAVNPASIFRGEFVYAPSNDAVLTETGSLVVKSASLGAYEGGNVTVGAGLNVNVTAGMGYVIANSSTNDYARKITWPDTTVALPPNTTTYVYANVSGVTLAAGVPDPFKNVLFARVITRTTVVEIVDTQLQSNLHPVTRVIAASRDTAGATYAKGSIVTIGVGNTLNVTDGEYFYLFNEYRPSGGTAITFSTYRRDGIGGWIIADATAVVAQYDVGGSLAPIPAGQFVRHAVYTVGVGANEKYMLVFGQQTFVAAALARVDSVTTPPNYFVEGVTRIAGLVVDEIGAISVVDLRPMATNSFSGGSGGATLHGDLIGLSNDDHPQYLLANGARALAGDLALGGNAITGASTVNGVNVASHAARHLPNGADPLASAAPTGSVSVSSSNMVGTANSFARSDHTHAFDSSGLTLGSLGGILPVSKGGTGVSSLAVGKFLTGGGTSLNTSKVVPAGTVVGTTDVQTLSNKSLVAANTAFTGTGSVKITAGGSKITTLVAGATVADAILTLPQISAVLVGRETVDTLKNKTLLGGIAGNNVGANRIRNVAISPSAAQARHALIAADGTNASWSAIQATDISGVIDVTRGGTGRSSLPAGNVLVGNGVGAVNTLKAAPSGEFVGTTDTQTLSNKSLIAANVAFRGVKNMDILSIDTIDGTTLLRFPGASTLTFPVGTNTIVARDTTDTMTNKTLDSVTNTIAADRIRVSGGSVSIAASAAPNIGDVLVATSSTTAEWQMHTNAFIDNTFSINDVSDPSVKIKFNASGATGTKTTVVANQSADIDVTLPSSSDVLVGRNTADVLTNKTLITPAISTISNSGVLTLPTTTDVLVGRNTTDVLTNKTLRDTSTEFSSASGSGIAVACNGTPSTKTTIIASQSANATITLPASSDVLVGRNTADVMANKTLVMESTSIVDGSGRGLAFSAAGSASTLTTINTVSTAPRTLTLPNVSDSIVARSSTDTLTNKTVIGGASGNTVAANRVNDVTVSPTPPTAGQTLVATSSTTAAWQFSGGAGAAPRGYIIGTNSSSTSSASFVNVTDHLGTGIIPYAGSLVMPLIEFGVVARGSANNVAADVRLFDTTNGNTLATIVVPAGTTSNTLFATTAFANVPTSNAILEVEVRRTAGNGNSSIAVNGFRVQYGAPGT